MFYIHFLLVGVVRNYITPDIFVKFFLGSLSGGSGSGMALFLFAGFFEGRFQFGYPAALFSHRRF